MKREIRVLNIEDKAIKHSTIKKILWSNGFLKVTWKQNLEDAWQELTTNEYDLIITDYYYPLVAGGDDNPSGDELIKRLADHNIETPVLICSTAKWVYPGVPSIRYQDDDWDDQLKKFLKEFKKDLS